MNKIAHAAKIARFVHAGVKRKDRTQEPYFMHCLRVMALALLDGMDEDFCAACLLHDCGEDVTEANYYQYQEMLSDPAGGLTAYTIRLVEEVTRPSSCGGDDQDDEEAFKASSPAAKLLKLYDREDNLQCLAMEIRLSPVLWPYVDPQHWSKRLLAKYLEETPKMLAVVRQEIAERKGPMGPVGSDLTELLRGRCNTIEAQLKRLSADPPQVEQTALDETAPAC